MSDPEITVRKMSYPMQFSQEVIDDAASLSWEAIERAQQAEQTRRAAMTQAERDAEDAALEAQREAERLERTCPHCGCDPDVHGGY